MHSCEHIVSVKHFGKAFTLHVATEEDLAVDTLYVHSCYHSLLCGME